MDKAQLEQLVRQFLAEKMQPSVLRAGHIDQFSPQDRLDTGHPADQVYTHDLFSLEQSPRLGAGWMEMRQTTFAWKLDYDEMDYIVEGTLSIITPQGTVTGNPGDVLYIPKGSQIQFSAPNYAKFLYFTYPADWQNT